jgi:hypothetical protein
MDFSYYIFAVINPIVIGRRTAIKGVSKFHFICSSGVVSPFDSFPIAGGQ